MQSNKDAAGYLEPYAGLASALVAVSSGQDSSAPPEDIAEAANRVGVPSRTAESPEDALRQILSAYHEKDPRILICGSLYLAGEILKENW